MSRFSRKPCRSDRRARIGLEALEHRELLASSLTGALVRSPTAVPLTVATAALKTVATAPAAKPTAQNTLPPPNLVALDRVSKPLTTLTQADAAKLGTAAGQQSLPLSDGPIEAAHNGKAGVDLKARAQGSVDLVYRGVQESLNALGFGFAPHGGSQGSGGLAGDSHARPNLDKDRNEQSPILLTGHAGIDAAIAEMFRSPEDAAMDGLARGYNIGDSGQWTGELSFLQGEKIVLGGREQDGGTTSYDEKYKYAWQDNQGDWVLVTKQNDATFLKDQDNIHQGNGFIIVGVGKNQEVVPVRHQTEQKSSTKDKDGNTVVVLKGAPLTTEVTLPKKNSDPITVKVTDKQGNSLEYKVDPNKRGANNPVPPGLQVDDQGSLKNDTKKYPAPTDDLSGKGLGPAPTPRVTPSQLQLPGSDGAGRGKADLDKLIRGTVVLAVSKVNPPPIQPDQGGGINQGGDLGGDNAGGVVAKVTPRTTFRGPMPSVGPVVCPGRGPA